jgi:hypothetical protein
VQRQPFRIDRDARREIGRRSPPTASAANVEADIAAAEGRLAAADAVRPVVTLAADPGDRGLGRCGGAPLSTARSRRCHSRSIPGTEQVLRWKAAY